MADLTASYRKEKLQLRKSEIEQRILEIERREKGQARKNDTRVKVLAGAALLADAALFPDKRPDVVALLNRAITNERDREFLREMGWLA